MQGMCGANFKNTTNIGKRDKDNEHTSLCSNLNTLYRNLELVKSFFPHFFDTNQHENPEEDRSTSNTPGVYQEQPNTDDAHILQSNVKKLLILNLALGVSCCIKE